MFGYPVYFVVHLLGVLMTFAALGGIAIQGSYTEQSPSARKFTSILHGVALFLVLLGGFGLAARINVMHGAFPPWLWFKLAIWVVLGGAVALLRRMPSLARPALLLLVVLGVMSAYTAKFHDTPNDFFGGSAAAPAPAPAAAGSGEGSAAH